MSTGSLERKTREKFKHSFKDDQFGERLLIALIFFIFLAAFFHFREIKLDLMQIKPSSKGFIVAQVDFQFPDQEATLVLRQEAIENIGEIFKLNPSQIDSHRIDFENYLINHRNWRVGSSNITFDQMYNIADVIQDKLLHLKLTDSKTYQKIAQTSHTLKNFEQIDKPQKDLKLVLPPYVWKKIDNEIVSQYQFNQEAVNYVIQYFKNINWRLEADYSSQHFYKQMIESSLPKRFANQPFIDETKQSQNEYLSLYSAMHKEISAQRNLFDIETILSSALFALIITFIGIVYLDINHKSIILSVRKLSLYITILITTLALSKLIEYLFLAGNFYQISFFRYPLLIPFAAIMICVLIDKNIALFSTFILTIIIGITLSVDHSRFLYINLVTSLATILFAKTLRKRKEVFIVCAMAWLSSIPVILAYKLSEKTFLDMILVNDLLSTFICMLVTAIVIVSILPLIETIFQVMTDMTLMEFMDPNNELLRRLSLEAPGTYQHSLVVGSLSEAAAQAIGANGLFCRVSTLYHDIGKLFNPHYFTENQMGGFDIHQLLTPIESAQVIIAHVAEGEALARKHGLPRPFIEIIREHHGTTLVYYFYAKQIEQMGGEKDAVNENQFKYPGPKPRSKESAIIMIADSVEAASRSMENPTEDTIRELVDRLVSEKADEGQFDNCQLTFEELGIVKRTIVKTVSVTRHLRVKYPERIKT